MPYEHSAPVALADVTEIEWFTVHPQVPRVEVAMRVGLRRPDGSVQTLTVRQVSLPAAQVATAMQSAPVGATLYDAIKTALYGALIEAGELQGGSVA